MEKLWTLSIILVNTLKNDYYYVCVHVCKLAHTRVPRMKVFLLPVLFCVCDVPTQEDQKGKKLQANTILLSHHHFSNLP